MEVLFLLSERILCRQLAAHIGKEVCLAGWLRQVRQVGRHLAFWIVHDRSGWAQVVVSGPLAQSAPSLESVVAITGQAVASRSQQGCELQASAVQVLNNAAELPFELHHPEITAGDEQVFNQRVLSLRHPRNQAIFRIKATALQAYRAYLSAAGFLEVQTPKIVATGTEGGAELFPVQYFERPAYLAQSPQFYKQMLVAAGFERVFEVGPVFRAESHDTSRHTNEFTSLDLEMGFIDHIDALMDLETQLLQHMFATVQEECASELEHLGATVPEIGAIPRISLAEARAVLARKYSHSSPPGNLDPAGEKLLCQHAEQEWGSPLVFVTDYPTEVRPFYTRTHSDAPQLTHSFDLLFRGLEITTGGLRIHKEEDLVQALRERGLDPEAYRFYLQAFIHGAPPHGGFAIGLERLTARMLELPNVRHATLFPRDRQRLVP